MLLPENYSNLLNETVYIADEDIVYPSLKVEIIPGSLTAASKLAFNYTVK